MNSDNIITNIGGDIRGYNTYTYCFNNPVNMKDENGNRPKWSDVKKAWDTVKNAVCNFVDAAINSFQFDFGVGYGFGGSVAVGSVNVGASVYQDSTVGVNNGETFGGVKGNASVEIELIDEKIGVGASYSFEHRCETNGVREYDDHNTKSMPWDIMSCPKTIHDMDVMLFVDCIESDKDNVFFGLSGDIHIGIGGHLSIGWDVTEFIRLLED